MAGVYYVEDQFGDGQNGTLPDGLGLFAGLFSAPKESGPVLLGHRAFTANMRFGQLTFHGGAFTFEDGDTPDTFVPYNFAYMTNQFTQTPRMDNNIIGAFYQSHKASFPTTSGVLTEGCINPREGSDTSQDGIALTSPILCHIQSALPNQRLGMIGVIQPADNSVALASGDATCRSEIAHWVSLPAFANIDVIICAVVDRPFNENARLSSEWMDVIYYQKQDEALLNMRATSRNFQSVRGS